MPSCIGNQGVFEGLVHVQCSEMLLTLTISFLQSIKSLLNTGCHDKNTYLIILYHAGTFGAHRKKHHVPSHSSTHLNFE